MYMIIIFGACFLNYPQIFVVSQPKTRAETRGHLKSPATLSLVRGRKFPQKSDLGLNCQLGLQALN